MDGRPWTQGRIDSSFHDLPVGSNDDSVLKCIGRAVLTALAGVLIVTQAGEVKARELVPWTEGARPAFALDALAGQPVSLSTYSDRVVLVHFFATWCEPCRAEMAALRRLTERFAQKPLAILAISVAEVDIRVRRFFETEPANFPILLDRDRAVSRMWQVSTLPTTFVLDRSLKPCLFVEGDFDWDSAESDHVLSALIIKPLDRVAH